MARLAGVSQSAVSRAYTPGASVAESTREKILKAARELGYHPNMMARTLATNRSNIVALAISYLDNPFYAQVVRELSEKLRETGRHILLFTTSPDGKADPALEDVLSYKVDALILTATTASHELAVQCQAAGVPIVQINRESKLPGISIVRGPNELAATKIAEFLHAGGHLRYAFIGGTVESGTSKVRENAFVGRLRELGVKDVLVAHGDYTFEGAAIVTRQLLSMAEPPDAIFCASDYMAFATLDVAKREFNLKVPDDLSVIGFDNVPAASRFAWDLTTYSQPAGLLVDAAIDIIDSMIARPGRRAQRREVQGELILRGSAKRPPASA
ncbi:MAG: LacI family DNA-binding transcriptional regulator [Hyphomicrobiaceae bacterium]|nr:LacI family DNA-binding transcriptional regulator [Hyphomicrobiaceae bacterium]